MKRTATVFLIALAALLAFPAAAQTPGAANDADALERIARALEQIRADQRVLLTLRRVELAERRVAPLRERVEQARNESRSIREEIEQMETYKIQIEESIDEALRTGIDPDDEDLRMQLDQVNAMIEARTTRRAAAERRVIDLENDLARVQRRIDVLDEQLDALFARLDEGR